MQNIFPKRLALQSTFVIAGVILIKKTQKSWNKKKHNFNQWITKMISTWKTQNKIPPTEKKTQDNYLKQLQAFMLVTSWKKLKTWCCFNSPFSIIRGNFGTFLPHKPQNMIFAKIYWLHFQLAVVSSSKKSEKSNALIFDKTWKIHRLSQKQKNKISSKNFTPLLFNYIIPTTC